MKRFSIFLLLLMSVLSFSACQSGAPANPTGDPVSASETTVDANLYTSPHGFTLTFPEEWKDKVVAIEPSPEEQAGNGTLLYYKPQYDRAMADESPSFGKMFNISVVDKAKQEEKYQQLQQSAIHTLLTETDSTAYFFSKATDADCDTDNQEEFAEYTDFCRQSDEVAKTFQLS